MERIAILISALTLMGFTGIPHEDLIGFWKSHEQMTLESMRSTPGVTEKARELFERNFFGKLIIEYKVDTYRAKYEQEKDNVEQFNQYYPYKVIEKGESYYLLESYNQLLEENEIQKIYMEGDCYYVLVSKWHFKEYFCRMDSEL